VCSSDLLTAARAGYRSAISEAVTLGDRRLEGSFSSNLGALLLEQDEPGAARAALRQAVRCLGEHRDDRLLAIARVNLAAVELLAGHLDAADAHYADAMSLLGDEDPASSALCHARRGAVAALQGRTAAARHHHEAAERLVPEHDPISVEVVELWRAFLEWTAGDRASALARRRRALAGDPALVERSDEARLVVRILERAAAAPGAALLVGPAGAWVRVPEAQRVDVARYGAAARILAHLAATAEARPGETCDAEQLIAAGWPGEQILPAAAKNRLGVALARLRKLGLRAQLQRTASGWRLDPDWSVVLLLEDRDPAGSG
jgi:predicted negative regulator of RcsB-dependent stress response